MPMFLFKQNTFISDHILTKTDFDHIADDLNLFPGLAQKQTSFPSVALEFVTTPTKVTTLNLLTNRPQTTKTLKPGDAIATRMLQTGRPRLGTKGQLDQWGVDQDKHTLLYKRTQQKTPYGFLAFALNKILYLPLPAGGTILAPWGQKQHISAGFLQYSLLTSEIYLNEQSALETFTILRPPHQKSP